MTKYLKHWERIQQLLNFVNWIPKRREHQDVIGPANVGVIILKMARSPSKWRVLFNVLARNYCVLDFQDALANFIAQANYPEASEAALWQRAHDTHIPFSGVPVYYHIKFTNGGKSEIVDSIHIRREHQDQGQIIPETFDTVIVDGRWPSGMWSQGHKCNYEPHKCLKPLYWLILRLLDRPSTRSV